MHINKRSSIHRFHYNTHHPYNACIIKRKHFRYTRVYAICILYIIIIIGVDRNVLIWFSRIRSIYTDFCISAVSRRDSFVLFRRTSHNILYYYSDIWTGKAYQTAWLLLFLDALLKLYHINLLCLFIITEFLLYSPSLSSRAMMYFCLVRSRRPAHCYRIPFDSRNV